MNDPLNPELIAAFCHDLRGPLGALGTWIHILHSDRADDHTKARALAAIKGDVRALGILIEQLSSLGSTLSRLEPNSLEPIDLVPFLNDLVAAVRCDGGAEVTFRAPAPSVIVLADAVRLRQSVSLFLSGADASQGARRLDLTLEAPGAAIAIVTDLRPRPLSVALARALVEVQGGTMVESGTDIRILLPLAR